MFSLTLAAILVSLGGTPIYKFGLNVSANWSRMVYRNDLGVGEVMNPQRFASMNQANTTNCAFESTRRMLVEM